MSLKKQTLASMIISLIIGVILGVVILLLAGIVNASFIIKWTLIIMGIITIISNIPSLVTGIMNVKRVSGIVNLVMSILGIVLGIMMIFMQNEIITTILAIYLIVFPIVSVIISKDWKNAIKSEWLKILIGVLLIVFLPAIIGAADTIFKVLLTVVGWVTIGISVIIFAIALIGFLKAAKIADNIAPNFTETTAEEKE